MMPDVSGTDVGQGLEFATVMAVKVQAFTAVTPLGLLCRSNFMRKLRNVSY